MAVTINGEKYLFGFDSADAPTGITGFVCRSAEFQREPEVYVQATNGVGETEAVQVSKKENRKVTATFTGYILSTFDPETAASGTLVYDSKDFIVRRVSVPRNKGEFVEVSIEAEHYPLAVDSSAGGG